MKSGCIIVAAMTMLLLFLTACGSGIPSEEYDALSNKYSALQKEHEALQEQYNSLKAQTETVPEEVKEYQVRLDAANAYVRFFDVYVDIFRGEAGLPTKYGYAGIDSVPDYKLKYEGTAWDTGDARFYEKVIKAISLPAGEEKDKAYADCLSHLADSLLLITSR